MKNLAISVCLGLFLLVFLVPELKAQGVKPAPGAAESPLPTATQPPVVAVDPNRPVFEKDTLSVQTPKGVKRFTVELAKTAEQKRYGLMNREDITQETAMLFLNEKDEDTVMWMKDTIVPLDMLFIDSTGKIIYIASSVAPFSTSIVSARKPVRAVLELRGGTADGNGIHVGDRVIYSAFKP